MLNKTVRFLTSPIRGLWTAFDVRDVFVFGGLGLLGYGLWLRCQWLGFAVPGLFLFAVGLLWPALSNCSAKGNK